MPIMGSFGVTGRHSVARAKGPGVIVGRSGASAGVVSFTEVDYWPLNTCLFSTNFNGNNPRFVFYLLSTLNLASYNSGSAQPSLNRNYIAPIPISVPERAEQDEIANLLSALDDKIVLNDHISETLEAMAQAIFRDWFVDFGPVRRKLAGEIDPVAIMGGLTPDPTRATDLAELFPREILDDLPVGWEMSTLGETTTALLGGTPSRKVPTYWGGRVPWINSGEANEFRITRPSEFITEEGLAKSATKLLPRRTTVLAITGATLGQVSLTEIATCANQSVVGLVPDGRLPAEFVYLSVKSCIDEIVARQTGGAQQHINKWNVEEQAVMVPTSTVLDAWSDISVPIFDRIAACCFENQALAETRDYLLPRLMSGNVRVESPASLEPAQ